MTKKIDIFDKLAQHYLEFRQYTSVGVVYSDVCGKSARKIIGRI